MILYQVSVFLHILSAIIWIGGMLFLALVVVPTSRSMPAADRTVLFGAVGRRFRAVGWACIVVLIVTGVVNTTYRGVTWENVFTAAVWSSPFGRTLALKLGVVAAMLGLSVYHDFVIGPRSVRASDQGSTDDAQRLRKRASVVGRLTALLALTVLALAVMLVRGVP
jgi:copper resistance protein D